MNTPRTLKDYINLLNNNIRFVQANYGDGEWACILGHKGGNCNGEEYRPGIRNALIDTILNPPPGRIFYGSNPTRKHEIEAQIWLKKHNAMQRAWVFKEIFPNANAQGEMGYFIAAVRQRRTMLIGPSHLSNAALYKLWNIITHTQVPTHDAYGAHKEIYKDAMIRIGKHKPDLILVCSGMAANPMIFRLAKVVDVTIIDMGAALDPYAGIWSRNAHRTDEFQQKTLVKIIDHALKLFPAAASS